jgi:hypothetical protein
MAARTSVLVRKFFTPILKATSQSFSNGTDMAKLCKDELFVVDLNDGISARKKSWVMKPTFKEQKAKSWKKQNISFNRTKSIVVNGRLYFNNGLQPTRQRRHEFQ